MFQNFKHFKNVLFGKKYLFLTNMSISVSLSGIGDALQQQYLILNGHKDKWDKGRTRHMSITGCTVGIVCHNWYMFLDKKLPGRTVKIVAKKLIADQVFFSPICLSVFFLTSGMLERSSLSEICKEMIEKGKQLYTAEWLIWPPAQIINFYYLPTKYRILYDNTISLGFDIYTSHVKHDL